MRFRFIMQNEDRSPGRRESWITLQKTLDRCKEREELDKEDFEILRILCTWLTSSARHEPREEVAICTTPHNDKPLKTRAMPKMHAFSSAARKAIQLTVHVTAHECTGHCCSADLRHERPMLRDQSASKEEAFGIK